MTRLNAARRRFKSQSRPTPSRTLYVPIDGVAEQPALYREASPEEILAVARALLAHRVRRGTPIRSYRDAAEFLIHRYSPLEREVFAVILLDSRHKVIDVVDLFYGTIDGASIHPREVVKAALSFNAAATLCVHNHPSGVAEPSQADELITARLREALALVDIRLLDHLVIAGDQAISFAERGLL